MDVDSVGELGEEIKKNMCYIHTSEYITRMLVLLRAELRIELGNLLRSQIWGCLI